VLIWKGNDDEGEHGSLSLMKTPAERPANSTMIVCGPGCPTALDWMRRRDDVVRALTARALRP
jgi:hypothetical protein